MDWLGEPDPPAEEIYPTAENLQRNPAEASARSGKIIADTSELEGTFSNDWLVSRGERVLGQTLPLMALSAMSFRYQAPVNRMARTAS